MTKRDQVFIIESVVGRAISDGATEFKYLVKWEGFPSSDNSWVQREDADTDG